MRLDACRRQDPALSCADPCSWTCPPHRLLLQEPSRPVSLGLCPFCQAELTLRFGREMSPGRTFLALCRWPLEKGPSVHKATGSGDRGPGAARLMSPGDEGQAWWLCPVSALEAAGLPHPGLSPHPRTTLWHLRAALTCLSRIFLRNRSS